MDQGGHAGRAAAMDRLGRILARAERPVRTFRPGEGRVEHDPGDLVRSVRESVEDVFRQLGGDAARVRGAGLATQRSSIVCWDRESGQALSPVLSWQDTRAANALKKLAPFSPDVHRRTGLFLSPHYGAGKLAWCLENIPAVRLAAREKKLGFGPLSSYLTRCLVRESPSFADPVSASRTLLWNLELGDWDPRLLEMFGLTAEALPICVPTRHAFGHLEVGGGAIPLNLVTGDQSAALFAHGSPLPDAAYVTMGTGAFVARFLGGNPLFHRGLLTSVVPGEGDREGYVLEGTVNGAGSALEWARQALGVDDLWKHLPLWMEEIADPPLFLNGIAGLGAPYWDPDFSSGFLGQGEVPAKAVAVAESIAFLLFHNLEEIEGVLSGTGRLIIGGGLSRLDGISQRLADLSGCPVHRPPDRESTSRGVCYLLTKGLSPWPGPEGGRCYRPGDGIALRERYLRWKEAMERRIRENRPTRTGP